MSIENAANSQKTSAPVCALKFSRKEEASLRIVYVYVLNMISIILAVPSCAIDDLPRTTYESTLIAGVPHVQQKPDFCGEACAEMYLRKLGENIDQDYVFDRSGLDPSLGRGLYTAELALALTRIGFEVGSVWDPVRDEEQIEDQFAALHDDLLSGIPSIVCMHYSTEPDAPQHFRLVLGYDSASEDVIYHEPAERDGAYARMAYETFVELWPLRDRHGRQVVVRLRLEQGALEYGDPASAISAADFAQHVIHIRPRVPPGFTVLVERPFVVIGDGHPVEVAAYSRRLVRWSVDLLRRDFFRVDPDHIIDIWLFEDEDSYLRNARQLFGHRPDTPYGYYSERHRALIINIATGGGTLVHEIVHPFVAANFPECPTWLDEGLASLYEYPTVRRGHIHGLVNWRLPGLKQAIRTGQLPSFATLTSLTEDEFYEQDPGSNYAQSRYLCYYLQQHGLLVRYYQAFYDNRHLDPTGIDTLRAILGFEDLHAFQEEWEDWVLTLKQE